MNTRKGLVLLLTILFAVMLSTVAVDFSKHYVFADTSERSSDKSKDSSKDSKDDSKKENTNSRGGSTSSSTSSTSSSSSSNVNTRGSSSNLSSTGSTSSHSESPNTSSRSHSNNNGGESGRSSNNGSSGWSSNAGRGTSRDSGVNIGPANGSPNTNTRGSWGSSGGNTGGSVSHGSNTGNSPGYLYVKQRDNGNAPDDSNSTRPNISNTNTDSRTDQADRNTSSGRNDGGKSTGYYHPRTTSNVDNRAGATRSEPSIGNTNVDKQTNHNERGTNSGRTNVGAAYGYSQPKPTEGVNYRANPNTVIPSIGSSNGNKPTHPDKHGNDTGKPSHGGSGNTNHGNGFGNDRNDNHGGYIAGGGHSKPIWPGSGSHIERSDYKLISERWNYFQGRKHNDRHFEGRYHSYAYRYDHDYYRPSPYCAYWGHVPPYVDGRRFHRVSYFTFNFIYEPMSYVYYTDPDRGDYYHYSMRATFDEIERAWNENDIDLLMNLVRKNSEVAIFYRGDYQYSVGRQDYKDMTLDAMNDIETISFEFNDFSVRKPYSSHEVVAYGTHVYRSLGRDSLDNSYDEENVVEVSYTLKWINNRWYITEVGTTPIN